MGAVLLWTGSLRAAPPAVRMDALDEQYGGPPSCVALSASRGAILCLVSRAGMVGEWWAVFLDVKTGRADRIPLVTDAARGHDDASGAVKKHVKALARINRRLAKQGFVRVTPVWDSAKTPAVALPGGVALRKTATHVEIRATGRLVDAFRLGLDATYDQAAVVAYAAGPGQLVLTVDRTSTEYASQRQSEVLVVGTADGRRAWCPAGSGCPPHYGRIRASLGRLCSDDLSDAEVTELVGLARSGSLTPDDVRVLARAVDAMSGRPLRALKRFLHGPGAPLWLPETCGRLARGARWKPSPGQVRARDRLDAASRAPAPR